jgi:hypothetical protein
VGSALKTAAVWGIGLSTCLAMSAMPAAAQTEAQLKQAFEGQYVVVRMDMPATHKGVDVYPSREPAVDFSSYSARLREFGVSLREGDRVMVTAVRVKKRNIEFQLGGGGYGVFSDDSGSVYVPTESKSRREKDLEKEIRDERDSDRRRRLQRELDALRRDRERENRDREAEKRELEARKRSEIADKRLDAGSRFNVWFAQDLELNIPNPAELRRMLAGVVDFSGEGRESARGPSLDERHATPPPPASARPDDLRRGLSVEEVHDLLGAPTRSKPGKQGDLSTLTEWYEQGDRVTEVVYVSGIVVKFSTSSK